MRIPMCATRVLSAAVVLLAATAAQAQQPGQALPVAPARRGESRSSAKPADPNDHAGWTNIFDGTRASLANWDGDPAVWKLDEANNLVWAESTCEKPTGTTYLYWKGGEPADFELKVEMKVEPNVNSGFQYRSYLNPQTAAPAAAQGGAAPAGGGGGAGGQNQAPCPSGQARATPIASQPGHTRWRLGGPQFDFAYVNNHTGQYYEGGTGRGIIALRGDVVRTETGKRPRLIGSVGNYSELAGYVRLNDWNQVHIIARGNLLIHILNGHVMSVLVDDDPTIFRPKGLLGMQIEATGKVSYRNMWLKQY